MHISLVNTVLCKILYFLGFLPSSIVFLSILRSSKMNIYAYSMYICFCLPLRSRFCAL